MRLAFVHDWLTVYAGSERVLSSMSRSSTSSPIFTLLHRPDAFSGTDLEGRAVRTSFLQRLPAQGERYRYLLPLMPLAVEQFDLRGFDVVVSNVKAVGHGVLTSPDQLHVAYVNRPMRYAWDLYQHELSSAGLKKGMKGGVARLFYHYLRLWDQLAMQRPDVLHVNSRLVQAMLRKYHRRTAKVIYPPVDVDDFMCTEDKDDYFISVARLVPYKRVDLVVKAFNGLGMPLRVIGDGPQAAALHALARPNIEFLGWIDRAQLIREVEGARALVFAAEEEFGIAPVEAQAAGTPVIAFGRGGALETILDGTTGVLFHKQTADAIVDAVRDFDSHSSAFSPSALRGNAERFSKDRFEQSFERAIAAAWDAFRAGRSVRHHAREPTAG